MLNYAETGQGPDRGPTSKSRAAEVRVQRTNQDMRALVQVVAPTGAGEPVTVTLLRAALAEQGVVFGIDDAALKIIVSEKRYGELITVANGLAPVDGADANLVFHFGRVAARQNGGLANLGRVDYHELNKIINVDAEQLLLEKTPATTGQPGRTVAGREARQTCGKDIKIRAGQGVRVSEDGTKWYSTTAGQVIFRHNQIRVENLLRLQDVGPETGNVRFRGTIVVNGVVQDGFTVESGADVRVTGSVGAAKIIAAGDVLILGGILGQNKAQILSTEGDIIARFSQDARLTAAGNIVINEYAKNSDLRAGETIQIVSANKTRGRLIGGTASAGKAIHCNNIGGELEIRTRVMVGMSREDVDRIDQLEKLAATRLDQLDNLKKSVLLLDQERRGGDRVDPKRRELFNNLLRVLTRLRSGALENAGELASLRRSAHGEKKGFLHVAGRLHPNVEVHIGVAHLDVQTPLDYCTLTNTDGEVVVLTFKGQTEDDQ